MSSDFIEIIKSRGFVHQFTDEDGLGAILKTPGQRAYIGFDCTARSLHVGSLLQIVLLRWWQTCGHQPIVLLGGGTTKIGDPSGKDETRQLLSDGAITENMQSLGAVFRQFINLDGVNGFMIDNADWLDKLGYIQLLREVGPHFSVNRMLTMDSVKLRLEREQNLSFLEFNYMVLQAYDFVELNKQKECRIQMGGSDQWGNIIMGIELNRRLGQKEVFGITSPLITTSGGTKMGKTAAGAVWLNADLTSPYDYWQYWRNTEDDDVVRFLKLFTELSLPEIGKLATLKGSEINEAKKILATEATALLHGRPEAEKCAKTASETFGGAGVSEDLPEVVVESLDVPLYAVLVQAGFAESNGEAKRLIKGNGVKVNDDGVADDAMRLSKGLLTPGGFIKISAGKKRHVLVRAK